MRPVKRKDLVKKVAGSLGLPEEIVDEVVSHYYQTLQKKMSSLDDIGIYVANLGTFVVKKKRLHNKMVNHENIMKELGTDMSLVKYDIIMKKKENLEKMKIAHERLLHEDERKKEYKNLRKEDE